MTATDLSGNTSTIDFVMTVLRDTDNDGIPDVDDPDDDNDGIPDVDDPEPKVPDTTKPVITPILDVKAKENAAITPIQVVVTDDSNQPVKVSIAGQPEGISYNETTKQIEGTPTINDWGTTEETRDFTITVTATDLSGNTATIDFVMTVLRDTDNDGIPDVDDPDDDNDGIPDVDDPEPKVPDTTKPVISPISDVKAKENAAITPIAVVVTDDSNQAVKVSIDGQPNGVSYNETTKQIEGTPTINDWGAAEETRDFTITVTATDLSGNTSTIDFVMTVLRDTDNDGIPDVDDPDDDNDGIPDVDDPEPKVPDTAKPVIAPISDVKAKENAAIAPIVVVVTDDSNQPVKVSIDGQPVGVSYNETDKQIEGTPTVSNWGTVEETRDFTITVTATDLSGNTATIDFVMTVLRDTDNDGIPDVDDPDDDNDGIPDDEDEEPKIPDTQAPDAPGIDQVVENAKVITGTGEPKATVEVTLPNGEIVTTTVADDGSWTVDVPANVVLKTGETIPAKQTDRSGNTSEETTTTVLDITAPLAPVIQEIAQGDQAIKGTGEPGATVTVTYPDGSTQQTVVKEDGTWLVTPSVPLKTGDVVKASQTDPSGNQSPETSATVLDKTAPSAPVIHPVKEGDDSITGTGEPGATVTVTYPDGSTQQTVVKEDGTWSVTPVWKLQKNDLITARQTDRAGNTSQPASVKVQAAKAASQTTLAKALPAPITHAVFENATLILGLGTPGSTVRIAFADGQSREAQVQEDGNWQVQDLPTLEEGQKITISLRMPDGSASPTTNALVSKAP